jgi:hypothetical protein
MNGRLRVYRESLWNFESKGRFGDFCALRACLAVRGGAIGWGISLQAGRFRVRFPIMSLEFFIDLILSAALRSLGWDGGRLSL